MDFSRRINFITLFISVALLANIAILAAAADKTYETVPAASATADREPARLVADDDGDDYEPTSELDSHSGSILSTFECIDLCSKNRVLGSYFCNCNQYQHNVRQQPQRQLIQRQHQHSGESSGTIKTNKRQYPIDCQMLCFIGQGGKACNCNYAPFVGRK